MDLFEDIPEELKVVVGNYALEDTLTYIECEAFLKEVKALGYTFEYGLEGIPFNLRKIPKVIIVVRGGLVAGACSNDESVTVEVLDHDNWEDADCSEEDAARYEALNKECESMHGIY